MKTFLTILILFFTFQTSFGQNTKDTQPQDNWLSQYNIQLGDFLFHRYDKYSKGDINAFKNKLDLLKNSRPKSDWEGTYSVGYEETVSLSQLRLKSDVGYVNFYVYTCLPELRGIGYGKIIDSPDFVELIPEHVADSVRKKEKTKYIKVRWSENRYLVEENSLLAFSERAVGLFTEPYDSSSETFQKSTNFWVMGDFEKPLVGLPEFPPKYKSFERLPVETQIVAIKERTIEKEKTLGNTSYSESAFYKVVIGAGKNSGVKRGMKFNILETKDVLIITEVNRDTAIGLIPRFIGEDNKEDSCYNENSENLICPEIKNGLKLKTQIGNFSW